MTARPVHQCDLVWCQLRGTEVHPEEINDHWGRIGTAASNGSEVDVYAQEKPDDLSWSMDCGDWEIEGDDVDRELSDMRSIVDQIEAMIRGAVADYQRRLKSKAAVQCPR